MNTHCWIVYQTNEEGTEATVTHQFERQAQAQQRSVHMPYGGYEGPVPIAMYPIGKVFPLVD